MSYGPPPPNQFWPPPGGQPPPGYGPQPVPNRGGKIAGIIAAGVAVAAALLFLVLGGSAGVIQLGVALGIVGISVIVAFQVTKPKRPATGYPMTGYGPPQPPYPP